VQRGEVFRLLAPRGTRGREQAGKRFGVVIYGWDHDVQLSRRSVGERLIGKSSSFQGPGSHRRWLRRGRAVPADPTGCPIRRRPGRRPVRRHASPCGWPQNLTIGLTAGHCQRRCETPQLAPVSRQICVRSSDAEPPRHSHIRRDNVIRNRDRRHS